MRMGSYSRRLPQQLQQIQRLQLQRPRQPVDVEDRDVPLPALDAADVGAIDAGQVGRRFLTDAASGTEGAQALAKCDPWIRVKFLEGWLAGLRTAQLWADATM